MSITIGSKISVMDGAALGDSYLTQGNAMLRMLQALVQPNVLAINVNTPPATPNEGDTYTVGTNPTGLWFGQNNCVAYWTTHDSANPAGEWEFYPPFRGWMMGNQADGNLYVFEGTQWQVLVGSGTISSIGLSAPSDIFTVSGTPITGGSGTLALGEVVQNANTVWAGPASGSAATPGFRALVSTDIPLLAYLPSSTVLPQNTPGVSNQFISAYNSATGNFTQAQPSFANLSGSIASGQIASATITPAQINATGTPSSTTFLRGDGTWVAAATGTVTSVALAAPTDIFTVSGSPIGSSGTLTLTEVAQNANTVWAGPSTGSAANPGFRALVAADIPAISALSGQLSISQINATGTPSSTTFLRGDGTWSSSGAATGTVTSVAMTVPAELSVAGTPITISGTLAVTWSSASGNKVIASPSNGSSGAYSGRALVAADIPALSALSGQITVSQINATGTASVTTFLRGDGAWVAGSTGTVTSVALAAPSDIFTVSGSPVGTSGTLTFTKVNQSANTVWAGPSTGSATAPTFRTLVAADVPALSALSGQISISQINATGTASSTTFLRGDGTWSSSGAATGTVTSVAMTVPAELSISGTPITTSGTLALTWGSASGNKVIASPSGGGSGAYSGRALVAADIPALSALSGQITVSQINATGTASSTTFLRGDGSWVTPSGGGGGGGTVTSVALTAPTDIFIVSGSPIGTAGTLAITEQTQTANTVWAGPSTGSATTPAFRALVAADIPSLSYLSSSTVIPATEAAVAHNFLTSYSAATGLFAQAQPAFSDLSGSIATGQIPSATISMAQINATGTASSTTFLRGDGSWVTAATGTVTSVALAVPSSIFSVSGSPIGSSGTLTISEVTQTANTVWAGPSTGSAANPAFRALVAADIPSLPYLSSSTVVPSTEAAVAHKFLTSYTASSGLFTQAQPAFTDVSGSISTSQIAAATITMAQLNATGTASSTTFLRGDGSWVATATGTVTSVALTAPSDILTVGGSPIGTSGTLTLTKVSQSANTVWAGPTTGSAAAPTFRTLGASDVPALSALSGLLGVSQINATGTASATTFLRGDGSWVTPGGGGGGGTVTSVAMTVPAELSISGSPVTSTGTLALTWGTASGSKVIASPAGGGSGAYAGRVLVASDIPALPYLPSTTVLAQTVTAVSHEFLTSYTATTGAFTAAQPAFTDLSGSISTTQIPAATVTVSQLSVSGTASSSTYLRGDGTWASFVLAANTTAVAHEFFSAYSSSTGLFTQTQPAFTDLSGSISSGQIPLLTVTVGQLNATGTASSSTYLRGDGTWATISGGGGSGSGTVNNGTAGQLAYYATTTNAVSSNPDVTVSGGALTVGVAGTTAGTLVLAGSTSGTVTLATQAAAGTQTFTFPNSAPAAVGQVLVASAISGGNVTTGWSSVLTSGVTTVTFSATPTFNAALGGNFKITLTGNVTSSTLSNPVAGQFILFEIIQDATGGRTFVWPTNVKGGTDMVTTGDDSLVANATTVQLFWYDGTNARAVTPGVVN